jgi:hypothetical protein
MMGSLRNSRSFWGTNAHPDKVENVAAAARQAAEIPMARRTVFLRTVFIRLPV